jgi:sec-independent protein translocase protein TatA
MNVFGIGLPEMALILVIALLVFGPKKLPEVGRSLAQALNSFKKAQQEFESEIKKETESIQKSMNAPMKAEIERPEPKALPHQDADVDVTDAVVDETMPSETSETTADAEAESTEVTVEENQMAS